MRARACSGSSPHENPPSIISCTRRMASSSRPVSAKKPANWLRTHASQWL